MRITKITPSQISGEVNVANISSDSRRVSPGALFVCMPSLKADNHRFLPQAAERGAVAALCYNQQGYEQARSLHLAAMLVDVPQEHQEFDSEEEQILHYFGDYYEVVWRMAVVILDYPSQKPWKFGVTGTNGKTTTAWMIRDLLNSIYQMPICGYIGTLGFQMGGLPMQDMPNTTPFAVDLQNLFHQMTQDSSGVVAMEVSSHALAERRCDGVEFDVAVLTNLTQDHLDYHRDMESYGQAKRRLFTGVGQVREGVRTPTPIINIDDEFGRELAIEFPKAVTYGLSEVAEISARNVKVGIDTIQMTLTSPTESVAINLKLGGEYNVFNFLAASAALYAGGSTTLAQIARAASDVRPVPGRFEPVQNDAGIGILVDYAHTPDALEKLLSSVKTLTKGKVLVVFGCGGDRDAGKRPLMGQVAMKWADRLYITSDNPRTEDSEKVVQDVVSGIYLGEKPTFVELDRPKAVLQAILDAQSSDTVVIAGKGHENYQIIGQTKYPMDDRELARKGLEAREMRC